MYKHQKKVRNANVIDFAIQWQTTPEKKQGWIKYSINKKSESFYATKFDN